MTHTLNRLDIKKIINSTSVVEFYFILKAQGPVPGGLGMRLFTMSVLMVAFGWLSEIDLVQKVVGFVLGCACWL